VTRKEGPEDLAARPTERFSDRVGDYVRFRPSYPAAVVAFLHRIGLPPGGVVADIGAGTGISAKLFLDAGHRVIAVEPNAAMREAADAWLGQNPGYSSVAGTAEATALADGSVDLVAAAQAFHWFDAPAAKREFLRILRPEGRVALFWNKRLLDGSPFLRDYEALLRQYGVDYDAVAERYGDDATMEAWFGGPVEAASFDHEQRFDFDGLRGRLCSSSYAPKEGHPSFAPMMARLRELFDADVEPDGRVAFRYETRVYAGRPPSG
jgi:SAM-dependent methyltransferase